MALITVNTIVNIPADGGMLKIGRIPTSVALRALEDRVVRRVGVAHRTHATGRVFAVRQGEPGVIECCAGPGSRRVAGHTGGRETGCRVGRICCGVVRCRVATIAIRWQGGVIVVYVAHSTGNRSRGVIAGQWENRRVVIEHRPEKS